MAKKPTYEELEQWVKDLEKESIKRKQAEKALQESEARFKLLYERTPLGYQSLDKDGNFIEVNPAWLDILGYSREEVIGKSFGEFLHPDWKDHFKENFPRFKAVGEILGVEFEMVKKDGSFILVSFTGKIGKNTDGSFKQTHCIFQDVTERRQAEKRLQESEERFRLLSEASFEGILIHDKGKIIDANRIFANSFGYKPGEIIGMDVLDLVAPESRDVVKNNMLSGFNQAYEAMGLRKDGSTFPGQLRGREIEYKGNKVRLTAARDLSEQKKSEEKLRESESKYRLLAENVKDIIWVRDMDLNLKYVSPSVEKIRGYTPEEVMELTLEEVLTPESTKTAINLFSKMFQLKDNELPDDEYLVDLEHYCKNGKTIWLELKISWLYDSNGERSGILGVSRDITERKQLEDQLRQSQKLEAIGTLTGGVAHDFNNILGIILGNTELALDDVPEWNPAYYSLEDIKAASLRAAGIVKQLLSFSRKTDHELRPIKIIPIIKDALKFLRSTIPTTIEIRKNIPETDEIILADPTQINQVLMNLCINASQEMEETGGVLEVTVENIIIDDTAADTHSDLTKGEYVKLTVSDTGPGIDPEILEKIFDPYFTTKEVGKGSGMGLAVVRGIIKTHNGVISVESEPGKGTIFTILLPVATEKPEIKTEAAERLPLGTEKILFIDDEKSIASMTERVLERLGYEVETKTNPIEALELFQSKPDQFDLVITDMTMPQMTGTKLSNKLMEIRSDIPIIICTGHSSQIDEEKAREMGITAFVMKPIIKQNIAKTIREVLDN